MASYTEPQVLPRQQTRPGIPDLDTLSKQAGAWQRALPFTRLTDYGMDAADARELLWRNAVDEDWTDAAADIASRQHARSASAAREGRFPTARRAAIASLAAYNVAQVVLNTDTSRKRESYEAFQSGVAWYASLPETRLEPVEIDDDGAALYGWLSAPPGPVRGTVIVWGGLSGWGASFLGLATALAERGLACVLAEGPGQGATRLRSGVYGGEASLVGYQRFIDFVEAEPRLGGGIGIQGNSFGGLLAGRVAAADQRIGACVVNGASAVPVVPEYRNPREQILAFLGTEDIEAAGNELERLRFRPAEHSIAAPTLVLRGGADPIVTDEEQTPFVAGAAHPESRMLRWPDGEHTLYNHSAERDALTADWFAAHLSR